MTIRRFTQISVGPRPGSNEGFVPAVRARRGEEPAPTAAGHAAWLSLGPSSRLLGVDPDTLRRWADTGRVRTFTTPGGHRRFLRADLLRLGTARTAGRRPLSSLGATPERVTAAYARSYRETARTSTSEPFEHADRDLFRSEGRRLVELLLAFLDSTEPAARDDLEA